MNFEEANSFTEAQRASQAEMDEVKRKAEIEKIEHVKEFLKTRKIFKDLLPDDESLEKFKKVRDYLVMNIMVPQLGTVEHSDKFFRGYIDALDTIPTVIQAYDSYRAQYGDLTL